MRCLLRNVADRADRCLRHRPFSTLACILALWIAAAFPLLREIYAAFDPPRQVRAYPTASRPVDDAASRLERIE
jgi:hypothetical protein